MAEEKRLAGEVLDAFREVRKARRDGVIDDHEAPDVGKEIADVVVWTVRKSRPGARKIIVETLRQTLAQLDAEEKS